MGTSTPPKLLHLLSPPTFHQLPSPLGPLTPPQAECGGAAPGGGLPPPGLHPPGAQEEGEQVSGEPEVVHAVAESLLLLQLEWLLQSSLCAEL